MSDDNAGADNTSKTVYVGNLSWNVDEAMLRSSFSKYGEISSVRIPQNDRGQSKGFGFVEFSNSEDANKACDMNEAELDGRNIKVNISKPRENNGERRGGDRRGGYGGGGERRGGDRFHGGDRRGGDRREGGYNDRRGGDRRESRY